MAITKIADIIEPSIYNPYVIERTAELSNLVQSGVISQNSELDRLAANGGLTMHMPFFTDLSGDDEVVAEAALTPDKIGTSQDIATMLIRGKAWGATDLSKIVSGADPMMAIGDLNAAWWTRKEQKTLISILTGVFAAASMSSHVLSVASASIATASDVKAMSASVMVDAMMLLGDAFDSVSAIMVHSTVYATLVKNDLIEFLKDSTGTMNIPTYMGKRVIIDDGCPATAITGGKIYTSYLFGAGAIGRANGFMTTEVDRDKLAGEDYLIQRRGFVLHPRGVKWKGTASGVTPTNTELATGTNWERVYESKNIKLVAIKTNA